MENIEYVFFFSNENFNMVICDGSISFLKRFLKEGCTPFLYRYYKGSWHTLIEENKKKYKYILNIKMLLNC